MGSHKAPSWCLWWYPLIRWRGRSIYCLQGWSSCALHIQRDSYSSWNQYYPNTNAVATKLSSFSSNRSLLKQQLLDYGKVCVKAGYEYFHQKFDVDLKQAVSVFKQAVSVFKQARFFNPAKIGELKPSCADTDDLKAIPGLRSGAMDHFPVTSHIHVTLIITRWIMPGGASTRCQMYYVLWGKPNQRTHFCV